MSTIASLSGKVALVTGASRGIGAAIAKRLAHDGASVAITYSSSPDKANGLVADIKALGGQALAIQADSADAEAVKNAVEQTVREFGRLDILVNNAGIAILGMLDEFPLNDFDRILAVNVRGVFVASQAAAKHLGHGGRIINIGSTVADHVPMQGNAPYTMSKSAIVGLTKGLARDLGPKGITVNNVQPGPIDTDMNPADGQYSEMAKATLAIPRYGKAEEVAAMVAYLASEEAAYVTGTSLTIDGGFGA